MAWGAGVALLAWLVGVVMLGRNWHGYQRSPGVWIDSVSLTQWVLCWAGLALLGMSTAQHLRGWNARVLTLVPLVAWIAWQLRGSALGPIPMLVYTLPTGLVWGAALVLGSWAHRWLARSVNDEGA